MGFYDALKYQSITGVPVTLHGEKYNAQIANIKNTQTATENTTNGAIAQIKYAPAVGRDSFVVKAATWYSIEGRDVIVEQTDVSFIPGGQVRSVLLLLIDSTNRVMIPTGVENPPVRELGIGHWTARLSITADNCDPLHGDIGFTILGDRKWDWDKPAFTLYHQKKSVVR